jgi:adenylate cyclase
VSAQSSQAPATFDYWRALSRLPARASRRIGMARLIGLLLLVGLLALRAWDPTPLQILREKTFDVYQFLAPTPATDHKVAIVDIDEASLAEIGQWPWPRTIIADLIVRMFQSGAATVGLDIMFPEPDRMSPALIADALPQLSQEIRDALAILPGNDEVLANILRQAPIVLARGPSDSPTVGDDKVIRPSIGYKGGNPRPRMMNFPGVIRNTPVLELAARGHGFIALIPELDSIVRRVPLVMRTGKGVLPTLSLEVLRLATGAKSLLIKSDKYGMQSVAIGGVEVPTDSKGRVWVRFGHWEPERYIPASEVLNGTAPADALKGKIVLLGTSAAGLLDIKSTPLGEQVPGVEIHAQLIETILANNYLTRPSYADGVEFLILLIIGLWLVVLVPIVRARWTIGILVAQVVGLVGASWYLFIEKGMLIDVGYPSIAAFLVFSLMTYANYAREEKQRREIRNAFSRYVSPDLVNDLAANPGQLKLGGEMRFMSVLFCDIRGFTTISEKLDAEQLTSLINAFLTPMTDIILQHRGTIDKYMGDAIMAIWNAPLRDDRHAFNACKAALDMIERLGPLNETLAGEAKAEGREYIPIRVGVGVQSGDCCVGNLGSHQRFDYSVLGDSVNLASRLEGLTKQFGVTAIVGDTAEAEARELMAVEIDLIRVKGKFEPEHIFALLGDEEMRGTEDAARLLVRNGEMLDAYRAQDWAGARAALTDCAAFAPAYGLEQVYAMYGERIAAFEAAPPGPDWDGVFVAESK